MVEVKAQLLVELLLDRVAAKDGAEAVQQIGQHGHLPIDNPPFCFYRSMPALLSKRKRKEGFPRTKAFRRARPSRGGSPRYGTRRIAPRSASLRGLVESEHRPLRV